MNVRKFIAFLLTKHLVFWYVSVRKTLMPHFKEQRSIYFHKGLFRLQKQTKYGLSTRLEQK